MPESLFESLHLDMFLPTEADNKQWISCNCVDIML